MAGEGNYQVLDETIGKTAKEFRARGLLNETPLKLALDAAKMPQTPLWYPGKVVADEKSGHLFITDSNHNRVVIADQDGKVWSLEGVRTPNAPIRMLNVPNEFGFSPETLMVPEEALK